MVSETRIFRFVGLDMLYSNLKTYKTVFIFFTRYYIKPLPIILITMGANKLFDNLIATGLENPENSYTLDNIFSATGLKNPYEAARSAIYNRTQISNDIKNRTLTGAELTYLSRWYRDNYVMPTLAGSVLEDFFIGKFGVFLLAALDYKVKQNGATYGEYGDGQIHVQQIRPATAYVDATGAPIETWNVSNVTAGWNTSYFTIDLNNQSTTGVLNTRNNVAAIIFGHADFGPGKRLGEVKWFEDGTTPLGIRSHTFQMRAPDSEGMVLYEQAMNIPVNKKWTADVNFFTAGAAEPVLLGAQFVTEVYFQQE